MDVMERVSNYDTLSMIRPDIVAIPGWSDPRSLAALMWCLRSGTASVLMSDSTELDEVRVVSLIASALVAGCPQRPYLTHLGMRADSIFAGFTSRIIYIFNRKPMLPGSYAKMSVADAKIGFIQELNYRMCRALPNARLAYSP